MKQVTCLRCGWVHVGITKADIAPGDKWPYDKCFGCGGSHENTRPSREGDCPDGSTLQAILMKEEK